MSRSVRRHGVVARSWDVAAGDSFDLTNAKVRGRVITDIKEGKIVGALLAPPCSSFSPAGNCSFPLRTAEEPWGRPADELSENSRSG